MAITVYDPDERRRQNAAVLLQALGTFGQLAQIPGSLNESKAKTALYKQQLELAKTKAGTSQSLANLYNNLLPQLPGAGTVPAIPQTGQAPVGAPPAPNPSGFGFTGLALGPSGPTFNFGQTPQDKMAQKLQTKKEELKLTAQSKETESSKKLSKAVRGLANMKTQFDKALPGNADTPLKQRWEGFIQSKGAQAGLVNNPKLSALVKLQKPLARNVIRNLGEAGNLATSDVADAVKTLEFEGLTDQERNAFVSSFSEYVLSQMEPGAVEQVLGDKNVRDILDLYGVDLGPYGYVGNSDTKIPPQVQQVLAQNGMKLKAIREIKKK